MKAAGGNIWAAPRACFWGAEAFGDMGTWGILNRGSRAQGSAPLCLARDFYPFRSRRRHLVYLCRNEGIWCYLCKNEGIWCIDAKRLFLCWKTSESSCIHPEMHLQPDSRALPWPRSKPSAPEGNCTGRNSAADTERVLEDPGGEANRETVP